MFQFVINLPLFVSYLFGEWCSNCQRNTLYLQIKWGNCRSYITPMMIIILWSRNYQPFWGTRVHSCFCGVGVTQSWVFCVMFCRSLFVLCLLVIVFSVLHHLWLPLWYLQTFLKSICCYFSSFFILFVSCFINTGYDFFVMFLPSNWYFLYQGTIQILLVQILCLVRTNSTKKC